MKTRLPMMSSIKRIAIILIVATNAGFALAGNQNSSAPGTEYQEDVARGWSWYKELPLGEINPSAPIEAAPAAADPEQEALDELKALQKKVDAAKARAVLNPTYENVQNYMYVQQAVMNNAGVFADTWQRVLWANPELDYSVKHPINPMARQIHFQEQQQTRSTAVASALQEYGLFFFYKGSCPYCHRFAPILKGFSTQYQIDVLSVSLDGGTLPDYPNPKYDLAVAERLGVTTVPSVFLVHPKSGQVIPIANGLVTLDELEERIFYSTNVAPGEGF